jgi:hypothetical protein
MVAFLMMGVLVVLGFLCLSDGIPDIARSVASPRPRSRRTGPLDRPISDRFKRIEVLAEKS